MDPVWREVFARERRQPKKDDKSEGKWSPPTLRCICEDVDKVGSADFMGCVDIALTPILEKRETLAGWYALGPDPDGKSSSNVSGEIHVSVQWRFDPELDFDPYPDTELKPAYNDKAPNELRLALVQARGLAIKDKNLLSKGGLCFCVHFVPSPRWRTSCDAIAATRATHTGMEPTYAHTSVKGIKLAAGELSDSTEEEEVEAMEMYARLAEAEDPRDFEQTLQEARKRALQEENEIQQSIETLEELAREHVNDSLAVMEYRYELRQMSKFGFLSGLISAPRAHVERNVAKAVLQGSPKNLRTALMVLSTFPPVRYSVSSTLMPSS